MKKSRYKTKKNHPPTMYPPYKFGGLQDIGDFAANALKTSANNLTAPFTAKPIFDPNDMSGAGSQLGKDITMGFRPVAQALTPLALNMAAPELGSVASAVPKWDPNTQPGVMETEEQPMMYGRKGGKMCYPNGGMMPNANLELQENTLNPDGTTTQFDAPSHENGGVNTQLDPGAMVFSDKLKSKITGKTFAKSAKPYNTEKEEKILSDEKADKLRKATADLMMKAKNMKLQGIFQEQETQKQDKVMKYAQKMGVHMMANSSMMPNSQMKMGGTIKYFHGGTHPDPYSNDPFGLQEKISAPAVQNYTMDPNQTKGMPVTSGMDLSKLQQGQGTGSTPDNNFSLNQNQKDLIGFGINAIGQNIGNLAYLKDQGKRYDKVDYGSVAPKYLDPTASLRDANITARIARENVSNYAGGQGGAALANVAGTMTQNSLNKARIRSEYDNANVSIGNQFAQYNKGLQMKGMDDEARNKGQALTNYYQALGSTGAKTAGAYKDYRQSQMDNTRMGMLNDLYSNYSYNPTTNKWELKK